MSLRGIIADKWRSPVLYGVAVMVAVAAILVWLRHTDADTEVTMMYEWTGEEKAQMELAIRERDITLVPKCTEEYYEWRSRTKETREELYGKGSPEL